MFFWEKKKFMHDVIFLNSYISEGMNVLEFVIQSPIICSCFVFSLEDIEKFGKNMVNSLENTTLHYSSTTKCLERLM